jgi:ComF family protein
VALIRAAGLGLAHLFFPRLCEGCRSPLLQQEEVLCLGCLQELPRTGFHDMPDNEAALRLAGRIPYLHVTACCYFTEDGLLQHLLHRLKYEGREGIGTFLGRQLGHDLKRAAWSGSVDAVIPVPLHPKKEARRGYNQSALIAAGLAEVLERPLLPDGLRRIRHTASQTRKSREERVANVKGAFEADPEAPLRDRHLLIVDDVLTTGSTLEAAATALLQVPGVRVSLATAGLATD